MSDIPLPITVPDNNNQVQGLTAGRYLVTAVTGYALGRGWIKDDTVQLLVIVLPMLLAPMWGIVKSRIDNKKMQTLEAFVPDSVAQRV